MALVVGALMAGSGVAYGQDATQQAAREFAEGQRLFGDREFSKAAAQFEAAYQHKPHHAALYNAARARERALETVRAANLYVRYIKEAPADARDHSTAKASLDKLATRLGRIELRAAGLEDLKVDKEPATDGTLYVKPGSHVIEASKSGKPVQQTLNVEVGETANVSDASLVSSTSETPPTDEDGTKPTPSSSAGWSPAVVIVGGGLTVVGATLTLFSGIDVLSQKRAFDAQQTQANLDSGKAKELRTNILLGVTIGMGLLTGAAAIWLVDWHGGSSDPSVHVGFGPGSFQAQGTF